MQQVLDGIDAEEFAEWQAFDSIEPIGGQADDYRAGLVASILANIHRKKGAEAIRPLDLFPWHIEPRDPTTDSLAIKAAMQRLADKVTRDG